MGVSIFFLLDYLEEDIFLKKNNKTSEGSYIAHLIGGVS